eukprot:8673565-Alexandrium_andersonii.AAC.1
MSASLVGSEMCIRDRSSPRRSRGWSRPEWSLRRGSMYESFPACGRSSFSVSYTHLTLPTICSV